MKASKFINSRLNKNSLNALCLSIALMITGCAAPTFSEFQGADLIGKGKIKVTPYLTTTYSDDESEEMDMINLLFDTDGELQTSKGVIIAYGLNEKFDGHLKYESIKGEGGFIDGSVIGLGIKYNLKSIGNHRISAYLPISNSTFNMVNVDLDGFFNPFAEDEEFGGDEEVDVADAGDEEDPDVDESKNYLTIEPTLLGSSKFASKYDLNYSVKMIFKIDGDELWEEDSGHAFNFSLSIPVPNSPNLKLIPEYGILNIGNQSFSHSGIGFALKF